MSDTDIMIAAEWSDDEQFYVISDLDGRTLAKARQLILFGPIFAGDMIYGTPFSADGFHLIGKGNAKDDLRFLPSSYTEETWRTRLRMQTAAEPLVDRPDGFRRLERFDGKLVDLSPDGATAVLLTVDLPRRGEGNVWYPRMRVLMPPRLSAAA